MIIAIDIGGTKTLVTLYDKDKNIVSSVKFRTPKVYDDFLVELTTAKSQLPEASYEQGAIGVRGLLNRVAGTLVADSILEWKNAPIADDAKRLFDCDFVIENDSKLAGLAEARELPEINKIVYVTISTGIGSTLVVNGFIDADTIGSEVGKWVVEKDGQYRTWESFAGGQALYEKHGKLASELANDDPIWHEVVKNLAPGFVNICASYVPEVIIIGGGMGNHLEKYQVLLEELMQKIADPIITLCPIQKAANPEFAVVYGCYYYALDTLTSKKS